MSDKVKRDRLYALCERHPGIVPLMRDSPHARAAITHAILCGMSDADALAFALAHVDEARARLMDALVERIEREPPTSAIYLGAVR